MAKSKVPTQERGYERRDAILDATAKLLIEAGEKGISMQGVAALAGATTGSMYYFFSNRDDLLDGLYRRHTEAMQKLLPVPPLGTPGPWLIMSVGELIDNLFGRSLTYLASHPDAIVLLSGGRDPSFPRFGDMVATVLAHRMEAARAREVATMLVAVSTGTLLYLHNMPDLQPHALIPRISQVLSSYLANCELEVRAPSLPAH